jgi:uncharacterized protein YjbI with pentapeptide repeats
MLVSANLSGLDLSGFSLEGMDLSHAILNGEDLSAMPATTGSIVSSSTRASAA